MNLFYINCIAGAEYYQSKETTIRFYISKTDRQI